MSENQEQPEPVLTQPQPVAEGPASAGLILRRARENAGLHIAALAVSLKVPVRRLEALEAERWDQLPDPVFVRGLAASVCRVLKIDPSTVLSLLPQTVVPPLKPDAGGSNTPFREPGAAPIQPWLNQFFRPVMLAALALLAGALVIIFFPSMEASDQAPVSVRSEVVVPNAVAVAASQPGPAPAGAPELLASAPVPSPAVTAAAAPVLPRASAPVQAVSAPAVTSPAARVQAAASAPQAAPAAVSSGGVLVFRMRGPSWIEVVDAKAQVQLRRVVQPGEVVGVSGELPLSVVIGRVDVTDVQLRGKAFSLEGIARDNVARFEVK